MIPAMGLLNSLAVLQAWLSEHDLKGMPESTTGWIFSGYAFFLFFCGAQIGKKRRSRLLVYVLIEDLGPIFDAHDIRLLVIPGSIGMVLSMILMSFSTSKLEPSSNRTTFK